jgi:hypothetical protein
MGLFDIFKKSDPEATAQQAAAEARYEQTVTALSNGHLPAHLIDRLKNSREGTVPWTATMTPSELLIMRSHGIKPVAAVSATCWLHYGWSWTEGHMQGWDAAIARLQAEAKAAGANAVVDVKMRTVPLNIEASMDFTLIGTAVKIDGLPPSENPIVATVPALEFVKLLDASIVPTGIAVGAHYEWLNDWRGRTNLTFAGNLESKPLSTLWETVRRSAHAQLRRRLEKSGGGALAHVNFSQMFEVEDSNDTKKYLARHIVVATTVDVPAEPHLDFRSKTGARLRLADAIPLEFAMAVDLKGEGTPLKGRSRHHQSYSTYEDEGAI